MKNNVHTIWWILLVIILLLKSGVSYVLADEIKTGDDLFQEKRQNSPQVEIVTLTEPYVLIIGDTVWFVQSQLTTTTRTMSPLTERQTHVVESVRKQLLKNVWYPRTMSVLVGFPTDEQIRYRGIDYFVEEIVRDTTKYYLQQQRQPRVSI